MFCWDIAAGLEKKRVGEVACGGTSVGIICFGGCGVCYGKRSTRTLVATQAVGHVECRRGKDRATAVGSFGSRVCAVGEKELCTFLTRCYFATHRPPLPLRQDYLTAKLQTSRLEKNASRLKHELAKSRAMNDLLQDEVSHGVRSRGRVIFVKFFNISTLDCKADCRLS